jgi:cytochrome c-type biogenesis protein CcmH
MLWIALAVMTGLAMAIVLWPLAFRTQARAEATREADFYRAQLAEIQRDVDRGQLPPEEAISARAEAARRLIAAGDAAPAATEGALWRRRAAAIVVFLVVPAVSLALYLRLGQPDLPDAPLADRRPDASDPGALDAAVSKIEAHMMKAPDDRRGWEVLAPVYMRMGRFPDAAGAYRQILRLGEDTPLIRASYGEALVAASDGVVTADARAEFDRAPDLPMAKFYLALGLEQDGKKDEALAAYKALAPQATRREPWMLGLHARLAALTGAAPPAATAEGAPAEGAPAFSGDQQKMIEGMVQGLAGRLAKQGGSAEEWGRLIRAYSVLHEPDKARDALASARKALGANADIDALARELGI